METEEDILALQSVPCFGGSLKASESELLLTYLVAPYVRIPLVLNFFSDKQRMTLLQAPQLQALPSWQKVRLNPASTDLC